MFKLFKILILLAPFMFCFANNSKSSELTFKFINPSFGGDALAGSFLLQQAQMQNEFKEDKRKSLFPQKSFLERFTESFTSSLLHRLANKLVERIVGADGEIVTGTYYLGNYQIVITQEGNYYKMVITDLATQQTTEIMIPIISMPQG